MAYWRDKWALPDSNEYEFKYAGKYGAKGEKRGKRKKATPEQIAKQNQINRENRVRRLIKANFVQNDIWATLKYPEGTRKPLEEVKKDMRAFLTGMRREYKKHGEQFKFIYRLEIGKHGGIHTHILVNRLRSKPDTDIIMQSSWRHGRVNYQSIYERGGYKELASYIVKQPTEEIVGQMKLFVDKEQKELVKYSSSKNLIRPVPERTRSKRRTLRKLIEQGPTPSPGYYVDKNSIISGVNPYTGMSYYRYTEYRCSDINNRSGGG